jgi:hypothetical protein
MSRFGELDKQALDAWITREPDTTMDDDFEKWLEDLSKEKRKAYSDEFFDDRLDYDFAPGQVEADEKFEQWLFDEKFTPWYESQGEDIPEIEEEID